MEVLFGERGNSFISFLQQSARWTVPSEANGGGGGGGGDPASRIKRDYVHSFYLIVTCNDQMKRVIVT